MIYQELEARLGYRFNNQQYLESALTHRSFFFENRSTTSQHFERLEFLGDAVLGLVISDRLMATYEQHEEGELTKWRASLVNETILAEMAREWNLQNLLRLGNSEANHRDQLSARVLSSALEAVFGALYLDAGFLRAKDLITAAFASRLEQLNHVHHYAADYKTRLQELCQKTYKKTPTYRLVSSDGPDHIKVFSTEVSVGQALFAVGRGGSRRASEQEAARIALQQSEKFENGELT